MSERMDGSETEPRLQSPADLHGKSAGGTLLICVERAATGNALEKAFEAHHWSSLTVSDGERAKWLVGVRNFAVVVISGGSPAWLRELVTLVRGATTAPILVLTECGSRLHPQLLDLGADMVADHDVDDHWLDSAVNALIRRTGVAFPKLRYLVCEGLRLDVFSRTIEIDGEQVDLSPIELSLLDFLMTHPQVALRHQTIIKAVWSWKYADERNALRIHINRLRKKLKDVSAEPRFIRSLRGVGYSFIQPVSQFSESVTTSTQVSEGGQALTLTLRLRALRSLLQTAADFEEASRMLVEFMVYEGACDAGGVFVRDDADDKRLRLVAQYGMPKSWRDAVKAGVPLTAGFLAADTVLSGETSHYVDITTMSERYRSTAKLLKAAELPVILSVPLIQSNVIYGALGYSARVDRAFTPVHLMLLESAAFLLSSTMGAGGPAAALDTEDLPSPIRLAPRPKAV
ncbi:MAG: DNA-binding response regulator [Frankiales bacterium]|nr:DNA-binding response regulator [Frankiales bacterium]